VQVLGLNGLGVHAAALTSLSSKEEVNTIYADLTAAAAGAQGRNDGRSSKGNGKPAKKRPRLGGSSSAIDGDDEGETGKDTAEAAARGGGGGLRLVYVTPEKVVNSKRFMAKLEKLYQVRAGVASAAGARWC
jgi:superfamily II DNA helicase RecQ